MAFEVRRVVTGLGADGKSCVIHDGPLSELPGGTGDPAVIWRTIEFPADNRGSAETATPFDISLFADASFGILFSVAPGNVSSWHTTDTVDYVVVLKGRVRLELEAGFADLGPGDVVVDRGVKHSWLALGDEPAVMFAAVVRAVPLGTGSQFDENFAQFLKH
jgi:quercetin dioxygenase-like cupin family protein